MQATLPTIPLTHIAIVIVPTLFLLVIMQRWIGQGLHGVYANIRMLIQLLAVGYVLTYLLETERPFIVILVVFVIIAVAAWIGIRPMRSHSRHNYLIAFISIALGGGLLLVIVTQIVVPMPSWFEPRFVIPLAGMIFSHTMNSISLAGERFESELAQDADYETARAAAFRTSLIPQINALLAVGIVSLPGMMTGQILSGTDPLIAARYQIVVMSMMFGSGGLSVVCYLYLMRHRT
ncbi:MAG: ABC transporter permease [Arenicellales bacterium WSBS_2016_MAG_OTU3]